MTRGVARAFKMPTQEQQNSLKWLVAQLLETYKLQRTDIYRHPDVSRKSPGEAAGANWDAVSKGILLFLLLRPLTGRAQTYPLPRTAAVQGGASGEDASDAEAEICHGFRLTPHAVRVRFMTYHLLRPGELHDRYATAPCWFDGRVVVAGKAFTFRASPGNTLLTTFPDGKEKMLGGHPTDSLNGR